MAVAIITFYAPKEPYGFLSNFARYPVTVFGRTWPTSEHACQGCKTLDVTTRNLIHSAKSPAKAAALGRSCKLVPEWEDPVLGSGLTLPGEVRVKDTIMYEVVKAKFDQNGSIRAELLATGCAQLVEASPKDPYWGWGCNHQGLNKLGHILMIVRDELRRAV
jgi:ribA/ribD-fused uncharacterized protein